MRVRAFLLVAVVAALALLAAGCGGGGEEATPSPTPTPSAGEGVELTREQIIQRAVRIAALPDNRPDPSKVTATRMKECESLDATRWEEGSAGRSNRALEAPVWLVVVRGDFVDESVPGEPAPPRAGRFILTIEADGPGGGGHVVFDEREEGSELPRERILERALDEIAPPGSENEPDPSTATLTRTTFREALETLRREGAPDFSERPRQDDSVWLVEVGGDFVDPCHATPRPGKYFLVLALDGFVESSGLIPDATPTP